MPPPLLEVKPCINALTLGLEQGYPENLSHYFIRWRNTDSEIPDGDLHAHLYVGRQHTESRGKLPGVSKTAHNRYKLVDS